MVITLPVLFRTGGTTFGTNDHPRGRSASTVLWRVGVCIVSRLMLLVRFCIAGGKVVWSKSKAGAGVFFDDLESGNCMHWDMPLRLAVCTVEVHW